MCLPFLLLIFIACSRSVDNTVPEKSRQTIEHGVDAQYPAGQEGWMSYLSENVKYPQEAEDKSIHGTVVVQFVVSKEGNIDNVEALSGPEELKAEAVRVIKGSGKWIPARKNNQMVTAYRTQSITFALEKEESEGPIVTKTQARPEYPGGREGWMRYLSKNFKYPKEALVKLIQGTVVVHFVVDKEGNVDNVVAVSGPKELTPEAVHIIKLSGKWIPATKNNQKVNAYRRQSITFALEEQ